MKLLLIFLTSLFLVNTIIGQQITFCDDFEGYQNGDPITQTSQWKILIMIMELEYK